MSNRKLFMKNAILLLLLLCSSAAFADKGNSPDTYNLKRAIEAMQNQDYENAYKFINQEIDENPGNGYAYMWLGMLRKGHEEYGLALSACNSAVKKLPSKDKDYKALAYQTRAEVWLCLEDTAQALKDYAEAIKCTPEDMDLYKDRAQVYYEQSNYNLADQDYRKMISMDEGDVVGYVGLGRNANERKDYDEALRQYNYVVKLAPDYPDVYCFRVVTYAEQKKYNEAIDDAITALSLDDSNGKAFGQLVWLSDSAFTQAVVKLKVQKIKQPKEKLWMYCLGGIYENAKKYAEAIPYYKESLAQEQNDAVAIRVSSCYEHLGDFAKALDYCDQAIALDSTDASYPIDRSRFLDRLGRTDEAIKQMDGFLELYPESYTAYAQRGLLKYYAGNVDGAIEDLSVALALQPDFAPAYLYRGTYYQCKGDTAKARQDFEQCLRLDSVTENGLAYYACYRLGDNAKALEFLNKALAADPDGTFYNAACLYSLMGNKEQALHYLRKAFESGYRDFAHARRDTDFDNVRSSKEFEAIVSEFEQKAQEQNAGEADDAVYEQQTEEVPFTKEGGVCKVKCHINNLPLHFIFDTGASDVSISSVEATFMMKNDYLSAADVMGRQNYVTADGNISEGTVINLRDVQLGTLHLRNVRASVVRNQSAPLLLGQSVLSKLGKIEIDNAGKVLRITYRKKTN